MRVEFRMFCPLSFRWQGEFTWVLTGPSIAGISEAFPLPSTILGALASLRKRTLRNDVRTRRYSPRDVCRLAREALGVSDAVLRGPYMTCVNEECLAFHMWGQALMVMRVKDKEGGPSVEVRDISDAIVFMKGTALSMSCKVAVPHLTYTQGLLDPQILRNLGMNPSIFIDTLENNISRNTLPSEELVKLGGEGRVAILSVNNGGMLEEVLKKIWGSDWSSEFDDVLAYVASPVLIQPSKKNILEELLHGEKVRIGGVDVSIPREKEVREALTKHLKGNEEERNLRRFRVKLSLLAPGYDIARKCLRPIHLAILPGSILKIHNISPENIFVNGLGEFNDCLWGTVLPLTTLW